MFILFIEPLMPPVTSFYTVACQLAATDQFEAQSPAEAAVMFMTADARTALEALGRLSGRPVRPKHFKTFVATLEGRAKTIDGRHKVGRSYSQSAGGRSWRVEHTQIAPEQVPAMEALARKSQADQQDAPTPSRRRLRS